MSRKQGSKDTKRRVTPGEKEDMKMMFITGSSISEIKKHFNLSSMNSFYRWAEEGGWNELRDEHFKKIAKSKTAIILKKSVSSTEEALKDIQLMREKTITAIRECNVTPEKYSEASKGYLDALEMERKLRIEGLQLSFINDVAQVLRDEIRDPEIMDRIVKGLREIYERHQKASLPQRSLNA